MGKQAELQKGKLLIKKLKIKKIIKIKTGYGNSVTSLILVILLLWGIQKKKTEKRGKKTYLKK